MLMLFYLFYIPPDCLEGPETAPFKDSILAQACSHKTRLLHWPNGSPKSSRFGHTFPYVSEFASTPKQ
jgi:hypothetical protein